MLEIQPFDPQIFPAAVAPPNLSKVPHDGPHHTLKTTDVVFVSKQRDRSLICSVFKATLMFLRFHIYLFDPFYF